MTAKECIVGRRSIRKFTEQHVEPEKLEKIIGNIAGAGDSKVMLTVETGVEYIYAKDMKVNSEYNHNVKGDEENTKETYEEETKFLELDDGALLITEKQPSVKGVVVVCKGADDPIVCQRVLTAVMTVLGVNSTKVCVVAKE